MPAERGTAALLNGRHDLELADAQVGALAAPPRGSVGAEDIRDLEGRAIQLQPSLRGRHRLQRTDDPVWCLRLPAAAIRRATSSRLKTTGSVRGSRTGCIFAINSLRPTVMSKKNFNPLIAALSEPGEMP
jgi:hypothetical protein